MRYRTYLAVRWTWTTFWNAFHRSRAAVLDYGTLDLTRSGVKRTYSMPRWVVEATMLANQMAYMQGQDSDDY